MTEETYPANIPAQSWDDLRAMPTDLHVEDVSPQADNNARASYAAVALLAYTERVGGLSNDMGTQISDLISDLLHLADAAGEDADGVLSRAQSYYDDELTGNT